MTSAQAGSWTSWSTDGEIAAATGHDALLDPDLARSARLLIEPRVRELAAAGLTSAAMAAPDDASEQTKLLALFGFVG